MVNDAAGIVVRCRKDRDYRGGVMIKAWEEIPKSGDPRQRCDSKFETIPAREEPGDECVSTNELMDKALLLTEGEGVHCGCRAR